MDVRVLIGPGLGGPPADEDLRTLYAAPRASWLRVNMVSTADGAATGGDARTGSINNPPDKRVFHLLRSMADAIVVGAGTARTEGYRDAVAPLVVVSGRGEVPPLLQDSPPGAVVLATRAAAPGLAASRETLGSDNVVVLGDEDVDLPRLRPALAERGLTDLLCEGGPSLLADLLAVGGVDELCWTVVPALVGGRGPRIAHGPALAVDLELRLLLEQDGTLLGRWFVRQ